MRLLRFAKGDVSKVLDQLGPTDKITLVGDHGVYLMSFAVEPEKRVVACARGCDPAKDEDFWENKRRLYGGDDGGDDVGTAEELRAIVDGCIGEVWVELTPSTIAVTTDFKTRPKKKE
jgi:hypothetical protein